MGMYKNAGSTRAWDYIIVGAGSAGCVLAERLSADGRSTVLVLEGGGENRSRWVDMPKGVARLVTDPQHVMTYAVTQPRIPGTRPEEVWIRGRGLGGSSAVNGMIWSRGEPSDYDAWEDAGCTGWNGATMLAAFKAIEDHALGDSVMRGVGGPVRVTPKIFSYALAERMVEAGAEMGLARVEDLNASVGDRIGFYSHNVRNGRRDSAARAFLDPARKRDNVTVMTDVVVQRILFADKKAIGVQTRIDGEPRIFGCRGEIIVAGGSIESPLLLQRSGIGKARWLKSVGIAPLVNSPDVGEHMLEHLGFSMPFRLSRDVGINKSFFGVGLMRAVLRYMIRRDGVMATGPFEVGGFANLVNPDGRPDLQLYLGGYNFALAEDNHPVPLANVDRAPGMTIYGQLLRLTSEGSIRVRAPHPLEKPEITPNWLATEEDQRAAVAAIRYMRQFMARPALAPYIESELLPGHACQTDEALLDAFRRLSTCGIHATNTCRMGSDNGAVLDPRCRVNGVSNLRVVDCSAMPGWVTGNTNAPAMAFAWLAAKLILEDRP